jgi:hypothetical protein
MKLGKIIKISNILSKYVTISMFCKNEQFSGARKKVSHSKI